MGMKNLSLSFKITLNFSFISTLLGRAELFTLIPLGIRVKPGFEPAFWVVVPLPCGLSLSLLDTPASHARSFHPVGVDV